MGAGHWVDVICAEGSPERAGERGCAPWRMLVECIFCVRPWSMFVVVARGAPVGRSGSAEGPDRRERCVMPDDSYVVLFLLLRACVAESAACPWDWERGARSVCLSFCEDFLNRERHRV